MNNYINMSEYFCNEAKAFYNKHKFKNGHIHKHFLQNRF